MKVINNVNDLENHLKKENKLNKNIKPDSSLERNSEELKNKKVNLNFTNDMAKLQKMEELDKCKTRLLKYIVYKKRTKAEIRKKFAKEFDEDLLEEAISSLETNGYINDENYIKRSVDEFMAVKTLSIKEIRYKLMAKGLTSKEIDPYFEKNSEELNEYEIKSATKLAEKKEKQGMEEIEIKQFLMKKGYKSDNVKIAVSKVESNN